MTQKRIDPLFGISIGFVFSVIVILTLSNYEPFKKYTTISLISCVSTFAVSLWQLPKYRQILAEQDLQEAGSAYATQVETTEVRFGPKEFRALRNQLDRMTGDPAASARLLEAARQKHPTQSYDWCVFKVMQDLERDRM